MNMTFYIDKLHALWFL